MPEAKISLIIPAYNEEKYIGACLEHALKYSGGKFFEIIVIDNASTDRTAKIAESFSGIKVIREERKGLTHARQRGLEASTGDLIAYIDADTRMPARWLEKAFKFFQDYPNIVSLSGPYKYYDAGKMLNFFLNITWLLTAPITYWITGYMILGGNFIIKREAILKAGGFNQQTQFYGEDTDLARRLSEIGQTLFRMDFYMPSSSRRFKAEGFFRTNIKYALNYIWEAAFGRPFTIDYRDIRLDSVEK